MKNEYIIDGGDGGGGFFSEKRHLKPVSQDWFPGEINGRKADLYEVIGDHSKYTYVALTSRVTATMEEQMQFNQGASVVVHEIKLINGNQYTSNAIGMSFLEKAK